MQEGAEIGWYFNKPTLLTSFNPWAKQKASMAGFTYATTVLFPGVWGSLSFQSLFCLASKLSTSG